MVAKPPKRKLIISPKYTQNLLEIASYGYDLFGAEVSNNFISKVENKVMTLLKMPHIYPKNRFIQNTKTKVYRNILVERYSVLYSVTAHTIHVITIYHTAINPEAIKNFEKLD